MAKGNKQFSGKDLYLKLEEQGDKLDKLTKLLENSLTENAELRKKVDELEIKLRINEKTQLLKKMKKW